MPLKTIDAICISSYAILISLARRCHPAAVLNLFSRASLPHNLLVFAELTFRGTCPVTVSPHISAYHRSGIHISHSNTVCTLQYSRRHTAPTWTRPAWSVG
eukprot:2507824-Rhodomonas_salina.1